MIEQPPILKKEHLQSALNLLTNPKYTPLFSKMDDEYLYWDKAKYLTPENVNPECFWHAIKLRRSLSVTNIQFGNLKFHFTITGRMQEILHEFDMNFRSTLGTDSIIPEKDHRVYLISSIMEEAIASSQMEGASTTRKIAKEMLRKQAKPINKSQQMIANNYSTIHYLADNKDEDFSLDALLNIHRLISNNTLERPSDEGVLRKEDNIFVMNNVTGEIVHTPPASKDLENLLKSLCDFANENSSEPFIHPIIKGIIIHFMLAYFHPFVDGNGRTSRSLIYWYMLKNGYGLTEYLSISRVIYKSKAQYEKSFLYTELDGLDLSYFIRYNLDAMKKAYEDLKKYLQKKMKEQEVFYSYRGLGNINDRQSQILRIFKDKPQTILTAKELSTRFSISTRTARTDLQHLVELTLLKEILINKRMMGYIKSDEFENILANLSNQQP